jgi:long-chain acyl-CoA synthetase
MRVTPAHAERKSAHTTAPVDTAGDGGTTTMVDAFLRTVERRGEAPAILDADPRVAMSWRDYGSYARRMAACVATLGLAKGDTLGLLLTNRPEFHVADAGALMLGVTPFSMYNTSSPEQLAHLISDADCPVIVTEDALVGRLRAALKDSKANVEYLVVVEDLSWHELLSHKAIEAIPDVGPHDSDAPRR